jgi:alpha,alpha-trehalase
VDVGKTRERLLKTEDTDRDQRVTIEDKGPKHVHLPSYESHGLLRQSVRGNYQVSNLLQELALLDPTGGAGGSSSKAGSTAESTAGAAKKKGLPTPGRQAVINMEQLSENPVTRLVRMIRTYFWPALVRRIDADGLAMICKDPKCRPACSHPRIYVPYDDAFALQYYREIAEERPRLNLEVIRLPQKITPDLVKNLANAPGILTLDLEKRICAGDRCAVAGKPFMVPGGRFNEMYGWDSYFILLGLLTEEENLQNLYLAKSLVDNLVYEINHYGMILNANRSYYLLRSQPPFLTDMAWRVYRRIRDRLDKSPIEDTIPATNQSTEATDGTNGDATAAAAASNNADPAILGMISPFSTPEEWLKTTILAAIKEYQHVWMSEPRYIHSLGLSRYCSCVGGIPPETERSHFDSILLPYATAHNLSIDEFTRKYNDGSISEPALDEYFLHDRAVRESGHDTTYRLDARAAYLATVDLCSLLYKYETDIALFIREICKGKLDTVDPTTGESLTFTADEWTQRSERRRQLADKYLWNEQNGMYYDYDFKSERQTDYESVTTLWPLWAEMASVEQAQTLIAKALPKFEVAGGLVSGTKESRGEPSIKRPTRQWDYPYGWAPHQIMAWKGLCRYGYNPDTRRLAYRWLFMITRAFSDFNGVVPEKFDVVKMSHKVSAEYGNVGTEFRLVPREGFGWMNASYLIGLNYLTRLERRALGALVPPEVLLKQSILLRPQDQFS